MAHYRNIIAVFALLYGTVSAVVHNENIDGLIEVRTRTSMLKNEIVNH